MPQLSNFLEQKGKLNNTSSKSWFYISALPFLLISIDLSPDSNNWVSFIESYVFFAQTHPSIKPTVLETKINERDRCVNEIIIV